MSLPEPLFHADAAAVLAGTAIALFVKGVVLSYLQVRLRVRNRAFERAEDARLMGVAAAREPDTVHRIAGAWLNEHENTPSYMALAAGYVLCGGTAPPLMLVSTAYVAARLFQAYAQICALQPQRTLGYLAGLAVSIALAGLTASRIWSLLA